MPLPYDKTNPESIEAYAKQLIGRTFYDVLGDVASDDQVHEELADYYNNPRGRGSLGNLLEEHFFKYKPNSDSAPDFAEAKVELKVTPYEVKANGKASAGERLVISMIPNNKPIDEDFDQSHLLTKLGLILLILYHRDRSLPRTEFPINYVKLFSILSKYCAEDLEIIKDDYRKIVAKIKAGKAHELSEGDTQYLGACTKGASAAKSLQPQFYGETPAKRRAFSLKQSYMTYVINHYIMGDVATYDAIFSAKDLANSDFENLILERLKAFKGQDVETLCQQFGLDFKADKAIASNLVTRLLGVRTDNAAEFEKAGIVVKTIKIHQDGKPRESMSFPAMKIKEFIQETFEESEVYRYFSQTRFLFVVFRQQEDGRFYLAGAKFWTMNIVELESEGKKEWLLCQRAFQDGVVLTPTPYGQGKIKVKNSLPSSKATKIFHIRPHAGKSAYLIDGVRYGNGKDTDMDELPNGDFMTKQSFWLNKSYVYDIVKEVGLE